MTWSRWILSLIDITIVAYGLYRLFKLIRGTRAVQLIKGIAVLLIAVPVSSLLQLNATHQILVDIQTMLVVALPIVFQPELRRALEQIGQGRFFAEPLLLHEEVDKGRVIDEVARAVEHLARTRPGALIVIEREMPLAMYIETGEAIDGEVSANLLRAIFSKRSPLHDGAVILRGGRIAAAACQLPLGQPPENAGTHMGMRHRSALCMSEETDAVLLVVSEETGRISLAVGGQLEPVLPAELSRRLADLLSPCAERPLQTAAEAKERSPLAA